MHKILLLVLLFAIGCGDSPTGPQGCTYVGKLEKIDCMPEDSNHTTVFIYFSDGRIVKLRNYYSTPLTLKLGVVNKIYCDSRLEITQTSIGDSNENPHRVRVEQ